MSVEYEDIRSAGKFLVLLSFQAKPMSPYEIHSEELHSNLHTDRNVKQDNCPVYSDRDRDRGQVLNEKKKRKRRK